MMRNQLQLEISGMTCDGCVRSVEKRLKSLSGLVSAKVDLKAGSAAVEYDSGVLSPEQMTAAVEKLGFTARVK